MTMLVVCAVEAERAAILAGGHPAVDVITAGVGSAAAAATTARALAGGTHQAVLSAGIGGGFTDRVPVGGLALADRSIAADLGADSPDGFVSLDQLGFGVTALPADPDLLKSLRVALPDAVAGPILTVTTVTGTADGVARLLARHPDAVAEAMEGFGVATAAAQVGVPFAELRTISNPVGPRDRNAWRVADALETLTSAFARLGRSR